MAKISNFLKAVYTGDFCCDLSPFDACDWMDWLTNVLDHLWQSHINQYFRDLTTKSHFVTFVRIYIYNMHQDTKSARLIAVCKRIFIPVKSMFLKLILLLTVQDLLLFRFQCFFPFLVTDEGTTEACGRILGLRARMFWNFKVHVRWQ